MTMTLKTEHSIETLLTLEKAVLTVLTLAADDLSKASNMGMSMLLVKVLTAKQQRGLEDGEE